MQLKKRLAKRVNDEIRTLLNHTGLNSVTPTAQILMVGKKSSGLVQIHGDKINVMDSHGLVDLNLCMSDSARKCRVAHLTDTYNQRQLKAILKCFQSAVTTLPKFETVELKQVRLNQYKASGLKMVANGCNGTFGIPTSENLLDLNNKRKECIATAQQLNPIVKEQWYSHYAEWLFPKVTE